jgi:hypothetical protein
MPGSVPGKVVFDTTIYYKDVGRIRRWLDGNGYEAYFTPNNALELLTPEKELSGPDFEKRRQAVCNLLALTDDGARELPDTELLHASRLGYQAIPSGAWAEAARRFAALSSATPEPLAAAGLNLQPALDAITAAYGSFRQKVCTCQEVYRRFWQDHKSAFKEQGITYAVVYDVATVKELVKAIGIQEDIMAGHIDRICTVARELKLGGALVEPSSYEQAVGVYCRVYRAYIEYAVSTSKVDKNDFGDLQFFAYCDAGFRLVSSEQRWETISTQEGLDAYLVHLV